MFETAMFMELMEALCKRCHENSKSKGFWDENLERVKVDGCMGEQDMMVPRNPWNFGEKIALIHSELSEALEAHRNGNPPCEKKLKGPKDEDVPIGISSIEEEMADIVIRVADLCGKMELDLGTAILRKMQYNRDRPQKHNKAY